jgi:F420-dependent oxidoreductase-like protein
MAAMRLALMSEPQQGLSYEQLLALVRAAEDGGFEAFFRSDHYGSFPGGDDNPTTDAWTTLAGLARETARIRLGALVSPVTFRHPGALAKVVATVDEMSGGRVELGLGSGWNEEEHAQLGIPFARQVERFDMLEEELEILHGLWREPDGWSFEGRHWRVRGARLRPKPVQRPHPPIILGGKAKPRSIHLAARWADEYNIQAHEPAAIPAVVDALRRACAEVGRDPAAVALSSMVGIVVGRDEAEFRDRVDRMRAVFGFSPAEMDGFLARRAKTYLAGTPDRVIARLREYEAAGLQRIMLQDWLPTDLDHVALMAAEILPQA